MDLFRRRQPDYTSIELVSQDCTQAINAPGTLVTIHEPTLNLRRRFLPTVAVLFTTACACAVWSLRLTSWKDSLGFFTLVTTHRVAVQVFIHIVSSALTLLWTYGVCSTINLITRSRFARRAVSIRTLRLWTLISQARISFSIPFTSLLVCSAFCAICILPAWLWTGALTPQLTTFTVISNITLPKTGTGAYPFLNPRPLDENFNFECWTKNQANGTFTSCPGLYQSGSLLQSASSATTIDGSLRNHSKYDNTEYRYVGRSYGVGASVGLAVEPPSLSTLSAYNYTESGYTTTAKCIYNSSSAWAVTQQSSDCAYDLPCYFYGTGCFPNSNYYPNGTCASVDHYAQSSYDADGNSASVVAMGATNSDNKTQYYLAIATADEYNEFNRIQCQFFFKPTMFAVNVSTVNATISVTPLGDTSDPEPRGMLRSKVMDAINVISMVQTSLYVSTVGEALSSNVRNYVSRATKSKTNLDNASKAQVLGAVTDSMQAMADDVLQSLAAAALTWPDASERQEVRFTSGGVEIGEYPFIIAILVYQFLALIGIIAALVFSKFFYRTPAFDYSDVGTVSTAAHLGANPHNVALWSATRNWKGEPDDSALGLLSARYKHTHPNEPPVIQITPIDGYESERGSTMYRPYNIM